jgi:hypothetical protein
MIPVTAVGPYADEMVGVHPNTYVHTVVKRALLGEE